MPDIYVASKSKEDKKESAQARSEKKFSESNRKKIDNNKEKSVQKEEYKTVPELKNTPEITNEKDPEKKEVKKKVKEVIDEVGEKKTRDGLTSFVVWPSETRFETQESKEEIIVLLRRHMITKVPWVLTAIFMLFVPLLLSYTPILDLLPFRFQFIIILMWYLIVLAFVFEKFLSWYFNVFIITDERVIDVDFLSLVYKEITESKIDRIQDITFAMGGITRSVFNFGTVYIQTAGDVPRIEFEQVPKPQTVVKILNQLLIQEEQEQIEGRVR